MSKIDSKNKTILINSVYTGGYGYNKSNLPHEMINFFRDDNGDYYIYITPYGVIDNKLDKDDLKAVLFVRSAGDGIVEVLAKAEVDEKSELYTKGVQLYGNNYHDPAKRKQIREIGEYPTDKINEIKYGKKSLKDIHNPNAQDNGVLVTMKVKSICLPEKTFYLTHIESAKELRPDVHYVGQDLTEKSKIANQSMKKYFNQKEHPKSYKALEEILNNRDLWRQPDETPKFDSKAEKEEPNFFKVTRQQDNEVMFSNMFFYLFSTYPKLLQKFASEILNIEVQENAIVEREKDRMDIRIIDDKNYIIIENKIKSAINGMEKADGKTPDNEQKNGFKIDPKSGKYISQLSKYYEKAKKKNNSDSKKGRHIKGFVFTPNHNPIELKQYSLGEEYYEVKNYDKLYDFFCHYIKVSENEGSDDLYLKHFVLAMKKHTEATDKEFRNELMQRFADRIQNKN